MRTLRFLLITRAGRLTRIGGQCPPSRAEPGDRNPLRPHSPCARGQSYFRLG
jgi:hypothetical protein